MRTNVASMATAATSATPISLMMRMSPATKPPKTMMMSSAAEVMMRPVRCRPRETARSLSTPCRWNSTMRDSRKTS